MKLKNDAFLEEEWEKKTYLLFPNLKELYDH